MTPLLTALLFVVGVHAAPPAADKPRLDVAKALDEIADGKRQLDTFRLDVHWAGNAAGRSVTVYGNGVGILNRNKQFTLKKEQVLDLVKLLQKGKFTALKPSYGGLGRPGAGAPERLLGNVTVTIDGVAQGSTQLGGGEQSKELAELAAALLDACAPAAKDGVGADSLADGLKKIGKKELAPLTLDILVHRLIEDKNSKEEGFLLRVEGTAVATRTNVPGKGYGTPRRLNLTMKELEALTQLLLDNDAGALPINLYATHYTDFVVKVLDKEKNLQARQFARMTPETHGEKQKQFDRIYEGLSKLHQRVLKEGKEQPETPK